jgi:hypothetical protein
MLILVFGVSGCKREPKLHMVKKSHHEIYNKHDPSDFYYKLSDIADESQHCGPSGNLVIAFSLDEDGNYVNLRTIDGTVKGKPEETCILDTFKKYSFPEFAGAIIFKYTIHLDYPEYD